MSLEIKIIEALETVAADIKDLISQLSNKLNLAGGILTGKLTGNHISARASSFRTHVLATTTGSKSLDLTNYNIFEYTITGNTTVSFTNIPEVTDETLIFVLRFTMGATIRTITFNDYITWLTPDGVTPPPPTINKIKEYVITYSNGSFVGRVIPFY